MEVLDVNLHFHCTRNINLISIYNIKKIKIGYNNVIKAKQKYDVAVSSLSDLLDKKDALKKEQLITIIMKSDKTYGDVLCFLNKSNE